MKRFSLRWMAWYGDSEVIFDVPDDWDLTIAHIADGEDIGNEGIQKAFETPIGRMSRDYRM